MNKLFSFLFLVFCCNMSAQIHELGIFVGGTNYIGDVGKTTYVDPTNPVYGILYKWNKSPRLSYRLSVMQSTISGNDYASKEPSRNGRGYQFKTNLKEASAGIEFNFFDFNLHEGRTKFTPYVFTGINIFRFTELNIVSGNVQALSRKNMLAIPITLGVKTTISRHLVLGMEVGARYTLTDNLDGSNPKDETLYKFGNLNNNDWYVFSGLTLTYTFGEKPCYCIN